MFFETYDGSRHLGLIFHPRSIPPFIHPFFKCWASRWIPVSASSIPRRTFMERFFFYHMYTVPLRFPCWCCCLVYLFSVRAMAVFSLLENLCLCLKLVDLRKLNGKKRIAWMNTRGYREGMTRDMGEGRTLGEGGCWPSGWGGFLCYPKRQGHLTAPVNRQESLYPTIIIEFGMIFPVRGTQNWPCSFKKYHMNNKTIWLLTLTLPLTNPMNLWQNSHFVE